MRQHRGRFGDPLVVGVAAEAVVEARSTQPVAVRHLDGVDPGGVERQADVGEVDERVLVADCMHAVTQGDVLDVERSRWGEVGSKTHATSSWRVSPVVPLRAAPPRS